MTIQDYLASLRGKTAAVLGIGVSNTPLIELLCRSGVQVIACDKKSREALGGRVAPRPGRRWSRRCTKVDPAAAW